MDSEENDEKMTFEKFQIYKRQNQMRFKEKSVKGGSTTKSARKRNIKGSLQTAENVSAKSNHSQFDSNSRQKSIERMNEKLELRNNKTIRPLEMDNSRITVSQLNNSLRDNSLNPLVA